jgi:DNA polymerase-1
VVIMAMIKLSKNEELKSLGWKLILQIHDEVILEGPKESAKQVSDIVSEWLMKLSFSNIV